MNTISLNFAIIFSCIAAVVALVLAYRAGYKAAKKNFLIHLFKEKYVTPEQYHTLEEEDI